MKGEALLHQQVVDYLKFRHSDVMVRTDFAAGIKMAVGMATRHKRLQSGRAWPDLFIARSAFMLHITDVYYGLFIELKAEGTRLRKKDGTWASDHIAEQAATLEQLQAEGYVAVFDVGFEDHRCD